jgi:hypothetical protein
MQSICIHEKKNMPSNLNALIRYKTIDRCLSNPYRKWSIESLIDACSSALKEYRGIYTRISERTIREDLRVMRSDILGFNAPIVQQEGNYHYEDPGYSIFNVSIQETGLLQRVLEFMLEIRSEVKHPEMDKIIERISEALPETRSAEETEPEFDESKESVTFRSAPESPDAIFDFSAIQEAGEDTFEEEEIEKKTEAIDELQWSLILGLI